MYKLFFAVVCCLFCVLVFTQCSREELIGNADATNEQQMDKTLRNLAKSLAVSTKSIEVRDFIKKEVLKQFDGDNNFLLSECIAKPVLSSKENLKSTALQNFGETISNENLSDVLRENPLLQIAVPFCDEYEDFDWENEEPLVTFLPENYDEATTDYLDAYDSAGNLFRLDARELPENPVIVISQNERVIALPKTGVKSSQIDPDSKPYFENESYQYFFKYTSCSPNGEETSVTTADNMTTKAVEGSTSAYNRDKNDGKDILSQARFVSKDAARAVEGWPNGNPEFKVVVAYTSESGATNTLDFRIGDSGWIKKKFFTIEIVTKTVNHSIMTWYVDRYGRDMKYQWIEEDGGDYKWEISLGFSTTIKDKKVEASLKIPVQNRDEDAGSALVQYEDYTTGAGTMYSTGIVNFWVRQ